MDDDFVPEGCVPLMSAVEQFAKARRTDVPLAQAEIRTKLHSGSIVAQAMEQSTGQLYDIIPNSWATETALRWLESGECLLPDERGTVRITTERFSFLYRPERAIIFVRESDLQRLLDAKLKRPPARETTPQVISDAKAERHFNEWRKSRGDDLPSLTEDCNHMKQFGVSRARVRKLRKGDGIVNRSRGKTRRTLNKPIK